MRFVSTESSSQAGRECSLRPPWLLLKPFPAGQFVSGLPTLYLPRIIIFPFCTHRQSFSSSKCLIRARFGQFLHPYGLGRKEYCIFPFENLQTAEILWVQRLSRFHAAAPIKSLQLKVLKARRVEYQSPELPRFYGCRYSAFHRQIYHFRSARSQ